MKRFAPVVSIVCLSPFVTALSRGTWCRPDIGCAEQVGAVRGSLDATYGTTGDCWTKRPSDQCDEICRDGLELLNAAFPDAGCEVPPKRAPGCGF